MDEESPSEASRLPDALVPTVAHMYVLGETCGVNWNRSLGTCIQFLKPNAVVVGWRYMQYAALTSFTSHNKCATMF